MNRRQRNAASKAQAQAGRCPLCGDKLRDKALRLRRRNGAAATLPELTGELECPNRCVSKLKTQAAGEPSLRARCPHCFNEGPFNVELEPPDATDTGEAPLLGATHDGVRSRHELACPSCRGAFELIVHETYSTRPLEGAKETE